MWLERYDKPAPIEFDVLRKLVADNALLDEAITDLMARKKVSLEKEYIAAVPAINAFIESELKRHESYSASVNERDASFDELNALFQATLD